VEHVVFFPAPDGTPAFRRFAGLEEAVRFVEHLRNVENVSGASVHSLTEVPLSFKAWYRVELPSDASPEAVEASADVAPAPAPAEAPVAPAAPAAVSAVAEPSTIAGAIVAYAHPGEVLGPVAVPEAGSATGIVVPDQPFVAANQFAAPPVPTVALAPEPNVLPQDDTSEEQAQVLEPVFGARRERGIGFFAR
jgi:hypothetical protein